jgi:hypothetical protein
MAQRAGEADTLFPPCLSTEQIGSAAAFSQNIKKHNINIISFIFFDLFAPAILSLVSDVQTFIGIRAFYQTQLRPVRPMVKQGETYHE